MAEKIGLEVETGGSQQNVDKLKASMKAMRDEMKALKAAALNGDGDAARRLGEMTDRMNDLRDATRQAQGSGVEQLKNGFGLMFEGLKNFDFEKIKLAFSGLGSAMKAIPIFLIIEGIKYLIDNFDELSKGSGPLAVVLRAVGDALGWISDKIEAVVNYFTDLIGASSEATRALEKQGKQIVENATKSTDALKRQTQAFDDQITVAKAAGKKTVELELAKQQAIVDTNLKIAKQIEAFVRAGGTMTDEMRKQLTASLDSIRQAKVQEKVIELTDQKERNEAYKKHLEERKKAREDLNKSFADSLEDGLNQEEKIQAESDKAFKERTDAEQKELERIAAFKKDLLDQELKERDARLKENAEKEKELEEGLEAAKQGIKENSFKAARGLSDLYFQIQENRAKGNAAQELAIAKQKFNVDKAFNAAQGIMEGTRATLGTLAATAKYGPAISIPATALVAGLAALNVAKILAAKFDGGGSGGGASAPTLPTGGGGVPEINNPSNTRTQPTTNLDENGKNLSQHITIENHINEQDITETQNRVNRLKTQATF